MLLSFVASYHQAKRYAGAEYGQALVSWSHVAKIGGRNRILLDLENGKICSDISFPSIFVYFSGLAAGRSLRARVLHME